MQPAARASAPMLPATGRIVIRKISAYVALTKPRVIELLLVTTAPVMVLAAGRHPDLWLVLRDARRRLAERGIRERVQLLHRPRHRRA